MNRINLVNRVLNDYNRQNQVTLLSIIQAAINAVVDGYLFPVSEVSTAYTMNLNDSLILCDATSAAFTVTLKPAAEAKCKLIVIKKTDASANAITIDGDGAETIDGVTTDSLSSQYDVIRLMSDGSQWLKV